MHDRDGHKSVQSSNGVYGFGLPPSTQITPNQDLPAGHRASPEKARGWGLSNLPLLIQ